MKLNDTSEDIAGWEAVGRPEITKAEWGSAINPVYVVLVPGEDGLLITPNGRAWDGDERVLLRIVIRNSPDAHSSVYDYTANTGHSIG